jgi:hypothetical protein
MRGTRRTRGVATRQRVGPREQAARITYVQGPGTRVGRQGVVAGRGRGVGHVGRQHAHGLHLLLQGSELQQARRGPCGWSAHVGGHGKKSGGMNAPAQEGDKGPTSVSLCASTRSRTSSCLIRASRVGAFRRAGGPSPSPGPSTDADPAAGTWAGRAAGNRTSVVSAASGALHGAAQSQERVGEGNETPQLAHPRQHSGT